MGQYTAAVTSVSAATSSTLLFAEQNSVKLHDAFARTIYNDSTATLYVKLGTAASTTSFTIKLEAGGYYELPAPVYDGAVQGIWSAATGAARLTEVTV